MPSCKPPSLSHIHNLHYSGYGYEFQQQQQQERVAEAAGGRTGRVRNAAARINQQDGGGLIRALEAPHLYTHVVRNFKFIQWPHLRDERLRLSCIFPLTGVRGAVYLHPTHYNL